MSSFKNADAGVIVDQLIKTIQKERDYLSEIDGKIGDGDHGDQHEQRFYDVREEIRRNYI